jgi:hypothetical protein
MPQTAPQRNRKTEERAQGMPRTATQPDFADTEDRVYGLVSVLYHALQGAQACDQYINDAERAGDDELVSFFTECREAQNQRASRAKQLLVDRTDDEESEDDDDDESADEDSDDEE